MAFKNFIKNKGKDFSYFNKVTVTWSQFGAPDGYVNVGGRFDGYGCDVFIDFTTQGIMLLNEGTAATQVIEVSFNGTTVHAELDPTLPSRGLVFDNRVVSMIWFRIKSGSTSSTISINAWSIQ